MSNPRMAINARLLSTFHHLMSTRNGSSLRFEIHLVNGMAISTLFRFILDKLLCDFSSQPRTMLRLEILKCNVTSQFVIDVAVAPIFNAILAKKLPRDMAITARSSNHTLRIFEVWGCLVLLNYRIHPNMATVTKLVAIGVIHTKVKNTECHPTKDKRQ